MDNVTPRSNEYSDAISMTTHSDAKENYNTQNSPIRKSRLQGMLESTDKANEIENGYYKPESIEENAPIVSESIITSNDELKLFRLSTPSGNTEILRKLMVNLAYLRSLNVSTINYNNITKFDILTVINAYYKLVNQVNQMNHRINLNNFKITVIINHCLQMINKLSDIDNYQETSFDSSI